MPWALVSWLWKSSIIDSLREYRSLTAKGLKTDESNTRGGMNYNPENIFYNVKHSLGDV
jgi:hypothetical protein